MATPMLRARRNGSVEPQSGESDLARHRRRAAMRLLGAERAEEIFPVLLEEILALGFARALVAEVDFESATIRPVASLNCPRPLQDFFRVSLWSDTSVVTALHEFTPATIAYGRQKKLYIHPLIYNNRRPCWEAERDHRSADCLAVLNQNHTRRLSLNEQVCQVCEMRSYAALVAVEVPARGMEREMMELRSVAELANRYLARLFKVEHYFNRMRDMETTIAQLNTVMQSMPDPVILTDAQHRVLLQNRAAARFFKLPEEVTEGLAHAVELNNLLFSAALSSMAVSDAESSRDLTLVDAIEGDEVLFEAVCAPTLTREGVRVGMVTVMRDVTDLRRADEELRSNYDRIRNAEEVVRQDRDRLNLIVENVGDPIAVCDSNAKFVLLDPLARELFGAEEEDAVRTPEQMKNLARFEAYVTTFTYAFSHKESAPLRLFNSTLQTEVDYDARSGKIYDERGQVSYTVTVLRDFTALRKLEQLKMERRILEIEKFAATGRLAGTIAHEINNPMEAIKNSIYLMGSMVEPHGQPIYDILKKETERVARITRQMLGLYRHSEQVTNVDINSLVEDTLALFSRQLERAGVRVETSMKPMPPVLGSADQFRQILSNLIVNARDSMPEGGRLRIRTRHVSRPDSVHGTIRITIADSGVGIPPSSIATIFEPFYTTKGERGTGLGLWIVKGILENHSGKIRVRSKVSEGTVFRIELPIVR
jgi:PAS domain S-box-containing protein